MMGHIVVESLRKEFGPTVAVNELTFDVRSGSVSGFLGANGAGKTTTLRVLLGLVHATRGRATIDGQHYRELTHPTRKVGAVLEGANFHPGRTARNHMRVVAGAGRALGSRVSMSCSPVVISPPFWAAPPHRRRSAACSAWASVP
jgi:ABC-2 type transport system ATP-binding protein